MAYFRMVKARIYPPHGLFFLWQSKASHLFPYATLALKPAMLPAHSDEERAYMGTSCSQELNKALQDGYRQIFSRFFCGEVAASFQIPENCISDRSRKHQAMQPGTQVITKKLNMLKITGRKMFICGLKIIRKNPAKCHIAKLFLNSQGVGKRTGCLPPFSGLWCVLLSFFWWGSDPSHGCWPYE